MDDLLTVRQVQKILKVDRITVYRMLRDGRLKGFKIGQQWRFSRSEVERKVGINVADEDIPQPAPGSSFPTHCVQTIQDLFSEVGQISSLVIDMQGNPLTQVSHPCSLCPMMQSTPSGRQACHASWQAFAHDSVTTAEASGSKYFTCHAGLQYIGAPVYDNGAQISLLLAGQFYWQAPDLREEGERVRRLASIHNLPIEPLQKAAREIPVIDPAQHARVESWPTTAARAVQSILYERFCFIERLQQIANLTQIP